MTAVVLATVIVALMFLLSLMFLFRSTAPFVQDYLGSGGTVVWGLLIAVVWIFGSQFIWEVLP